MMTLITRDDTVKLNDGSVLRYIEATCGKTSAVVSFSDALGVRVCCKNASAEVWSRFLGGRSFKTIEDAIAGYRSAAMKSILTAIAAR